MANINLDAFPKELRDELIELGRQWGSRDTMAQAEVTLNAHAKRASLLTLHGFVPAEGEQLGELRTMLQEAGVDREEARGAKKETNQKYVGAIATGKARRQQAQSVLLGTIAALQVAGDSAAVAKARAALAQIGPSGDHPETLANQLDQLRAAFADPAIAPAAADRGGPTIVAELNASAAALRAVSKSRAGVPGTPAETQRLDLIDGLIVRLCRQARAAARSAARALGDPALAAEFQLSKLYRSKSGAPAAPATPAPVPTPA